LSIHQPFLLSAITALACCDFFSKYAGDETSIKWPNDLYWRDRKAGGILIENVIKNQQWDNTVIGMGININQTQFGQLENKTVSLKQITGKSFDPILLAEELCGFLDARLNQIKSTPAETIIEEYNKHLFKRNEKVKFRKDSLVYEAKVVRATAEGDLEIERGIVEKIHHGSVEWIL
jgi:BirA family transcriptional regulator, biotin operon repressor / biotin---[acetyl-CoA-carboxylase] ligase